MAANLAKWPSNRGLISKIRPSDGCKGDTVPSTVVRGYDLANLEVIWVMSDKMIVEAKARRGGDYGEHQAMPVNVPCRRRRRLNGSTVEYIQHIGSSRTT